MNKLFLSLSLLAVLSLSGCAALGTLNQTLTNGKNPIVQAGIDLAVGTAVGTDPLTMKAKAIAIKAIASQVLVDASNPSVTVAALESTLNARVVKFAPNPADLAAFEILTSTLEGFLNTYLQKNTTGQVTTETLVAISGVAQAVVTATSFYGA